MKITTAVRSKINSAYLSDCLVLKSTADANRLAFKIHVISPLRHALVNV